jgi:Trk K+ transport system NAD-binding subunit
MQLIYDWLTGAPNISLSTPVSITKGHWILCGYGRFGVQLHEELKKRDIRTVIIDPKEEAKISFFNNQLAGDEFITGTGTDAKTLTAAGINTAAGIIAGSDNDPNNLSIIMTARQLNQQVFVVGRQNIEKNKLLYSKINEHYHSAKGDKIEELSAVGHLSMQPSEIIARKIRAILIAPLLIDFLDQATHEDQQWANITISRLSAVIGENNPYIWTVNINKEDTPAIAQALGFGRSIQLKHITRDPIKPDKSLACITLLIKRGDELQLLPNDDVELKAFDQVLFCGVRKVKDSMSPILSDISRLNYVMTSKNEPRSYIWKKITLLLHKHERRSSLR